MAYPLEVKDMKEGMTGGEVSGGSLFDASVLEM